MQFENKYKYKFNPFLLFVVFGFLFSTILYFIFYYKNLNLLNNTHKELAQKELYFKINFFKNEIEDLKENILSIKESYIFKNYIKDKNNKKNITNLFLFILKANREFFQIRYIDKSGQELIKVEKNREGKSKINQDLQNKFDKYYFKEAIKLKENEIYLSDFDLNIEYGKIETQHKPTLRIAIPIYINNSLNGILIINKFTKELFEKVEFSNFFNIYLIDKDDYFSIHKDKKKSWSKDLKTFYNLKNEFPNFYKNILTKPLFISNSLFSKHINLNIKHLKTPHNIIIILKVKDKLIKESIDKIKLNGFIIGITILILSILLSIITYNLLKKLNMRLNEQNKELKKSKETMDKYISYSKVYKKKIEEQKIQLLTQSKHAVMGEMVSIIAHQWRQPLNVLSLKLFSILSDFQNKKLTDNSMEKYYEESYEIINEMSKIIETFRNFFKNKELEEIGIDEVIKDTLKFIDKTLLLNNIKFIYTKNINAKIKAVKNELIQVLLNIFKNSIDELKTKNLKEKFIEIETLMDKKYIIISIIDNAGGVKDELIKQIFEPYFSTKFENGTGIGLYMCKLIIEENLNGKICATNEDNGLKTIIKIPIKEKG